MFEDAIEKVSQYTRSVHSVLRAYGENKILTSTATLFFVNDEGYAITTRSFADLLIASGQMEKTFNEFKQEKAALPKDRKYENRLRELEAKYKYTEKSIVQARNMFIDCIDKMSGYTCHKHTQYDLAIIKFNDYSQLKYKNHAVFSKFPGSARQGKFLCRLGFPFPEFTNYRYNELQDTIEKYIDGEIGESYGVRYESKIFDLETKGWLYKKLDREPNGGDESSKRFEAIRNIPVFNPDEVESEAEIDDEDIGPKSEDLYENY